jgi:hypothetical protein
MVTHVNRVDAAALGSPESLAVRRRRESRREERDEQIKLSGLLARYLDPACTFWTSLENKPISAVSGMYQKRRGVRSGLPDVLVLYRRKPSPRCPTRVVFVELKSRRGIATKAQKQIRAEMLPAGATWWLARSARAALMALRRSGVVFRQRWEPPRFERWEGPFADPTRRLPQAPDVAAERNAATRRRRATQGLREAALAERSAHGTGDVNGRAKGGTFAPRDFLGSRLRVPLRASGERTASRS